MINLSDKKKALTKSISVACLFDRRLPSYFDDATSEGEKAIISATLTLPWRTKTYVRIEELSIRINSMRPLSNG